MNKKGDVPILLKAIAFVLLAVLILWPLSQGVAKIISVVYKTFTSQDNTPKEGDFSKFEEAVKKVLESKKERVFVLNLNYDDVVFETGDNPFVLQRELVYKNLVTLKEIKFKKIEKPENCAEDSNCICKCKLSDSLNQKNEAKCSSLVSCFALSEYNPITGQSLVNTPTGRLSTDFRSIDKEVFLVLATSQEQTAKIQPEKTYEIPLRIRTEKLSLKITQYIPPEPIKP